MHGLSTPHSIEDAVVIGAGLSGLCTAHALRKNGIRCVILEKEQAIAEPWRRRHPQLRLNTHRRLSSLSGHSLAKDGDAFPSRDEIVTYLDRYAQETGADIRFGVTMRGLERIGGYWHLDTSSGTVATRHVVVATGKEREPAIPRWPGSRDWRGRLIHSADLGDVTQYRNRRVLVVGAGNSGTDVLNHLVGIRTRSLHVSVRSGSVFVPKYLAGFPVQRAAPMLSLLPRPLLDGALALTERLAFGDLRRFGVPKRTGAVRRILEDGVSPAVDDGFLTALRAGDAAIVGEIDRFDATGVVLKDGNRLEPDIVIAATGYRSGLLPMMGALGVLDPRGMPKTGKNGQALDADGLWFVGMTPTLAGYFHAACTSSGPTAAAIRDALAASTLGVAETTAPGAVLHAAE